MPTSVLALPSEEESLAQQTAAHRSPAIKVLTTIIFVSMLCLLAGSAVPYGTAEAWWKALFICAILTLTILWIIEGLLSGSWFHQSASLFVPIAVLVFFSFLQTVNFSTLTTRSDVATPWNAISVDPFQTRFFALQLLALMLAGLLLGRYISTKRRLHTLINVVIGITVISALFGMLRQTTQHQMGFGLPLLPPNGGYGQFINKNHFGFLMEMGFGLTVGLVTASGVKHQQTPLYIAAALPIWMALVLSGSRGALIAMLAQVIALVLLLGVTSGPSGQIEDTRMSRLTRSWFARLVLMLTLLCGTGMGVLWLAGDRLATTIEQSRSQFDPEAIESRQGISRNQIWRFTTRMFLAHPVVGVGMGAYWAAVPAFHDASGTMEPQEAHNDYLELLASGGLIAAVLAMWFFVIVYRRTLRNLQSTNRFARAACVGATLGIVGVAVHSLVDFGLHMMVNALVFTTLLVIATSNSNWANQPAAQTT